jgi:hypothetical protein
MLKLVRRGQVVPIEFGGTTFRVRTIDHGEAIELQRLHSTRGRLDAIAHYRALWERTLVGWENLLNGDGEPVPFRPDLVWEVAQALPHEVAEVLLARSRTPEIHLNGALGNSGPS